jgi:hypothetical protein
MKTVDDIKHEIGFDPGEPQPWYYPAQKDRGWHSLELTSPLGLSGFGFGWDEAFWFFKSQKRNEIDHSDSDYWSRREPNWDLVLKEIRRSTGYQPPTLLIPSA